MAIKRLEAIYKFLQAAKNLIKNKDMSKEGILRFAKQEFGEVSDFLKLQIDNLFRKPKVLTSADKTYKQELRRLEGALGSLDSKQPGFKEAADRLIKKIEDLQKTRKADVVPINKQGGIVRRPEEFATRKEYERYLDETLGPPDDVFGSPLKDDLLKEWDKVNAKNVTPDIRKVIDEKEGDDFIDFVRKSGDEEGANKIQKEVDRLNKAIEDADKRVKATDRLNFIPGGSRYAEGNVRTAVRQFMRSEADAGKLKLSKDDYDALQVYGQTTESDPINIFRRYYGEDALDAADAMADKLQYGESFKHYEEIFRKNMPDLKVKVKGAGEYDDSVKAGEELRKLSEFDPGDRKPNADGGLINILKL